MNYRLAKMDWEGLVTGYLVVIIGVYARQEWYASALPNFHLEWTNPNVIFFFQWKRISRKPVCNLKLA